MPSETRVLGILTPVGGGDPIPLRKAEVIVGRRPSCDIRLDFSNISGKHCMLRFINSVWHARDLGSTNGTSLNGTQISSEHTVMPDDEIGIASHLFTIVYQPGGPEAVLAQRGTMGEEMVETKKKHSLLELAGISDNEDRARPPARSDKTAMTPIPAPIVEEEKVFATPEHDEDEDEAEEEDDVQDDQLGFGDSLPAHVKKAPKPTIQTSDDDFFKIIEENLKPDK